MSMQVIEKRVWCFTVSPGPLSILEEDDELDGDFEEDEKADPEDVLGPDDEDDEDFEDLSSASDDEGDEDFEDLSSASDDEGGEDPEEEPEDDDEDDEDFEDLSSASDDEDFEDLSSASDEEDFEVRLVVDFHSTIDRVLEMFNASRAVLGVGPNDTVTGLIAESTAVQLHASLTH